MAKKELLPHQIAEIKRQYLQKNDTDLAISIGSTAKIVMSEMKRLDLVRDAYTEEKLKIIQSNPKIVKSKGL